jgi:hypothetical protein
MIARRMWGRFYASGFGARARIFSRVTITIPPAAMSGDRTEARIDMLLCGNLMEHDDSGARQSLVHGQLAELAVRSDEHATRLRSRGQHTAVARVRRPVVDGVDIVTLRAQRGRNRVREAAIDQQFHW